MEFTTHSETDTEALGERLASLVAPGCVIGLVGPLGAGQTALVRGLARGLGVADGVVHSPTFLSATEYEGRVSLVHVTSTATRSTCRIPTGSPRCSTPTG